MNNQPFFSIITCTRNSQKYVGETIKSVEQQTCRDFEHIFIDGLSTDNTVQIIQDYQKRCPDQVKYISHKSSGTAPISNAMNEGVKQASGQVILHLHSDDYLYSPKVLEQVKQMFSQTNAPIIVGNCYFLGDDGKFISIWPSGKLQWFLQKYFYKNLLFYTNTISHPSTYVKKWVFQKYGGFDENIRGVMDLEFWLRVFSKVKVFITKLPLSVYRAHAETDNNLNREFIDKNTKLSVERYKKDYRWERFVNAAVFSPVNKLLKLFGRRWHKDKLVSAEDLEK